MENSTMPVEGHLDLIENGIVAGWAYDAAEPGQAVRVTVLVDGDEAATVDADAYRADLEAAGFGDGRHAFRVRLPRSFILHGASVTVLAGDGLWELSGGPLTIDLAKAPEPALASPQAPGPPSANTVDLQQRFARGLSAWGRLAFEALPGFIDDALTSTDPNAPPRRLASNLTEIVKDICAKHPVIELPFLTAPQCSIIIPAYNNFEITYDCIKSLHDTGATEIAEIILADDLSNDAVVFLGSLVTNLRVSRNIENLGFLLNCNRAAKMARGDIVLFLNNDTIAQPGWLQECLATFDKFDRVGIVGSRLLYDDGVLQEAGGIIWADGSAWNFGNRGDGNAPEFNYVREVDYVTGASLAIRRDLLEHFGGFDEEYVPAYCEDADICLKASSEGWRVLYQPFSRLIHLEGKSHGQDVKKGVKAYQVRNSEKLFERWKDYIADNGPNASQPWMNKDRRHIGRALVLDAVTPTPDKDAGSIATYEQMLVLRDLGYKISFIPEDNFAHVGEPTQRLQAAGIECVYGPYVQSVDEWLEKYGSTVDIIHVYRYNVLSKHWQTIKRRAPHARIIYSNADMHFLRMQRQAELTGDTKLALDADRARSIELDLHKRADYSIVTSNFEVELLEAEAPGAPVKLLRWINEVVERNPVREGRDAIAFLGGYQHPPNVDAIDYFMAEILPRVVERAPETRFLICGSAMPERFQDYAGPNVEVVGFVPDLVPLFARCVATVAPIRFGAGFKGKVATSLSHGVPCVGTAIALEGMGFEDGEGIVEAETPEAYAAAIAKIYRDKKTWRKLATRGIAAVDRLYSREAAMRLWSDILTDIGLPVRRLGAPLVAPS